MTPEWFIPWDELTVDTSGDPLGRGGFGSVYRAKWLDSNVVVKHLIGCQHGNVMSSSLYDSLLQPSVTTVSATKRAESMTTFLREVNIWFRFSHPHVIRLFGACLVGRPFFVCEYATNGTLVSYLRNHPDELWSKLHEAALGVQYLHARNVVHGDLKGNNIVIGSDKKAKVTDFGLSSNTSDSPDPQISGASHWDAPECFISEDARPTFASDIYSLGMCFVEAVRVVEAGGDKMKVCLPWRRVENIVVKHDVTQGKLPPRPEMCNDTHWRLIEQRCVFEPEKRLKISTVVDELARLSKTVTYDNPTISLVQTTVRLKSVPEVISAACALLERLRKGDQGGSIQHETLYCLYESLWAEVKQVHSRVDRRINSKGLLDFCSLADESTKKLETMTNSLLSLT
ncbi:hypothetical protein ON010_g8218 [Phytophthora cinnamomi]|nr:hypothetical protein ON010_g8218 [Phytophthora cinnamomi]